MGGAVLIIDNPEFNGRGHPRSRRPRLRGARRRERSDALAFLERRGRFAAAPRPAFVVLDFRLPDLNAPEVLRRISGSETLGAIPVLVVSQANWDIDETAALEAGAKAFRAKPSRVRALREILVGFWDAHGSQALGNSSTRRGE